MSPPAAPARALFHGSWPSASLVLAQLLRNASLSQSRFLPCFEPPAPEPRFHARPYRQLCNIARGSPGKGQERRCMAETRETSCRLQPEQPPEKSPQKFLGSPELLCYSSFCNQTAGFGHSKQTRGFEKMKYDTEAGREQAQTWFC